MFREKRVLIVLTGCLFISSSFVQASGLEQTGKVCAAAGAVLVGIGGFMGLCGWLFSESDEQLSRNVQDEYKQLCDVYSSMVQKLEQTYHLYRIDARERHRIITDVNETLLYDFAVQSWRDNKNMTWLCNTLSSKVSSLRSRSSKLAGRLYELRAKVYTDYEAQRMLREMNELVETINQALPHFELLRDYVMQHKSYFALYEAEDRLRTRYERELQVLTDYPDDRAYIRREIKRVVVQTSGKYPHIGYVEQLDRDIQTVEDVIARSAYNYADRLRWVRWISENLSYIKGIVVVEPAYTDEIRMRERERVEREQGVY